MRRRSNGIKKKQQTVSTRHKAPNRMVYLWLLSRKTYSKSSKSHRTPTGGALCKSTTSPLFAVSTASMKA